MSNPDINCLVTQLNQEAIEAAHDGQWDQVIALHERRLSLEKLSPLSPDLIHAIVKCDEWLIVRIKEVQSAIQQNLLEIQNQRRKLTILKHHWGAGSITQSQHLLSI
jgi:tRNA A37 N6-isopentenylltransferase MiaA